MDSKISNMVWFVWWVYVPVVFFFILVILSFLYYIFESLRSSPSYDSIEKGNHECRIRAMSECLLTMTLRTMKRQMCKLLLQKSMWHRHLQGFICNLSWYLKDLESPKDKHYYYKLIELPNSLLINDTCSML